MKILLIGLLALTSISTFALEMPKNSILHIESQSTDLYGRLFKKTCTLNVDKSLNHIISEFNYSSGSYRTLEEQTLKLSNEEMVEAKTLIKAVSKGPFSPYDRHICRMDDQIILAKLSGKTIILSKYSCNESDDRSNTNDQMSQVHAWITAHCGFDL